MSSFLLRMLGDTEYGLYQTISAFAMYLVMLEFGIGSVMARNIAVCRNSDNKEKIKNNISTIWYIAIILSAVIATVAIVFCISIDEIYSNTMTNEQIVYGKKIFAFLVVYLIASFYSQTLNGLLLGYENYTYSQKVSISKIVIRTILITIVLLIKQHAILIAIIDTIISLVIFVVTFIYCKKKYSIKFKWKYFDKRILKDALPLCMAMVIQTFVNQANSSVGKFIIGIMMSMESVAIYSVAQYVYSIFSSITTIPISMYMPQVAKDVVNGLNGKRLTQTLVQPCRLIVILGGMIMCGFFAVGKQFVILFYGQSKEQAWVYALIIIIPMFINMANGILINVLDVLNKRIARSYVLLITTILNIFLSVFLMSRFGIIGAVLATAISTFIGQDVIMNIYYSKKIKISVIYLFKEAFKGILPIEICSGLICFILANSISNNLVSMAAGGISFVLLCGVGFILIGFNQYEKNLVFGILKKVKKLVLKK